MYIKGHWGRLHPVVATPTDKTSVKIMTKSGVHKLYYCLIYKVELVILFAAKPQHWNFWRDNATLLRVVEGYSDNMHKTKLFTHFVA